MSGAGERRHPDLRLVSGAAVAARNAHARGDGEDPDALAVDAASGDREALRDLVTAHEALVLAIVRRYARTRADARDLVARSFLRAVATARRSLRRDPERALAFRRSLVRAALAAVRTHLRREVQLARTPLEQLPPSDPRDGGREGVALGRTPDAHARGALLRLRHREREVLTLAVDAELRLPEIADVLAITAAAVKANLRRATSALVAARSGGASGAGCASLGTSLSLRAVGALVRPEATRIEAHLAGCAACRAEADGIAAALAAAALPPASEVERRALDGVAGRVSAALRRRPAGGRVLPIALAAAAATVALALALLRHPGLVHGP